MADREGHGGRQSWRRLVPPDPDQPPDEVVARAKAAFGMRSDDEVAVLIADSLVEDEAVDAHDHCLVFEHASLRARVRINSGETRCDLGGRIEPVRAARVVTVERDGAQVALVEQVRNGEFALAGIAHGLVRLQFATDGPTQIRTDWFRI